MQFIAKLECRMAEEPSYFRRQLLKEDLARLEKLRVLSAKGEGHDAFVREGGLIGWTSGDLRTHEFQQTLTSFLDAFYACASGDESPARVQALHEAWNTFDADRMEKLVGCLAARPRM